MAKPRIGHEQMANYVALPELWGPAWERGIEGTLAFLHDEARLISSATPKGTLSQLRCVQGVQVIRDLGKFKSAKQKTAKEGSGK